MSWALSGIFIVSSFYLSFSLSLSASITQLVSKLLEVGGREKDHLLNKNYMTDFFGGLGVGKLILKQGQFERLIEKKVKFCMFLGRMVNVLRTSKHYWQL
jgi:hypothetical protein